MKKDDVVRVVDKTDEFHDVVGIIGYYNDDNDKYGVQVDFEVAKEYSADQLKLEEAGCGLEGV